MGVKRNHRFPRKIPPGGKRLKTEARMWSKNRCFNSKTENVQTNFGVRCFNALNVQFHSNSFIQRCPSITLWKINVFHSLSKKIIFLLCYHFVGLVEPHEPFESEPSTFHIFEKQSAMQSPFYIEVKSVQSTLSNLITTSVPHATFTRFLVEHGLFQYHS